MDTTAETEMETESEVESSPDANEETTAQSVYKDGTYSGTAYGYDGDITVTITIENDVITAIDASSAEEDLWYFEQAESPVVSAILDSQSTSVDAVSGATYSSKGIMKAVENALAQAKNG